MAINNIPGVGPQNTDIATAVAAAVPTLAQINNSVATNAPNPSDWTLIGNSGTGWNTFTFSSISGYKRLRLFAPKSFAGSPSNLNVRINGNTTAGDYINTRTNMTGGTISAGATSNTFLTTGVQATADQAATYDLIFEFANLTTLPKTVTGRFGAVTSTNVSTADAYRGYFGPTGAITSITILLDGAITISGLPLYLLGQN
jgi:hypothetical protein